MLCSCFPSAPASTSPDAAHKSEGSKHPKKATFQVRELQSIEEMTADKRIRLYHQQDLKEVRSEIAFPEIWTRQGHKGCP